MVFMHEMQETLDHQRNEQIETWKKYCDHPANGDFFPKSNQTAYKQTQVSKGWVGFIILPEDIFEELESWVGELRLWIKIECTGIFGGEDVIDVGETVQMQPAIDPVLVQSRDLFFLLLHL